MCHSGAGPAGAGAGESSLSPDFLTQKQKASPKGRPFRISRLVPWRGQALCTMLAVEFAELFGPATSSMCDTFRRHWQVPRGRHRRRKGTTVEGNAPITRFASGFNATIPTTLLLLLR